MRTMDAVAADGIILIDECTDPFSVESVRASMGAIFSLKISLCSSDEFFSFKEKFHGQIIGTALDGKIDYRAADWKSPCIILLGNEQFGLSENLKDVSDQLIKMPMRGHSDSLNLAVSCVIKMIRIVVEQTV